MATLLEYECPACGGSLQFDAVLQKVKCPYCDSQFDVDALAGKDVEETPPLDASRPAHWQGPEADQIGSFLCNSCGGEILCDQSTAATHCPFCDSPVVMQGRLTGVLRPDLVIPFQLDKEAAKAALQKHVSGKILLPRCFKSENRIEKLQGVYVPFWLYDADTDANITYRATKVRTWSDSDYHYTNTRYYDVQRAGTMGFEAVPVDGSSKMADELMESIEPFDLTQAVPFQSVYLTGYLADKYDVDPQATRPRANERIQSSTADALRQTVSGYSSVNQTAADIRVHDGRVRYALLPVWLLNTKYQGKDYTFAMNGQTGKMVGDLPVDKLAYWLWFGGITVVATALSYLIGTLIG